MGNARTPKIGPVSGASRSEIVQFVQARFECLCYDQADHLMRDTVVQMESQAFERSNTKTDYLIHVSNAIKFVEAAINNHRNQDPGQDLADEKRIKEASALIDCALQIRSTGLFKDNLKGEALNAESCITAAPQSFPEVQNFQSLQELFESTGEALHSESQDSPNVSEEGSHQIRSAALSFEQAANALQRVEIDLSYLGETLFPNLQEDMQHKDKVSERRTTSNTTEKVGKQTRRPDIDASMEWNPKKVKTRASCFE